MARKSKEELKVAVRDYHIHRKPITLRQFKLALLERGLTDEVEVSIANMESPKKEKAQIEWSYSTDFTRSAEWIVDIVENSDISVEEMDILFHEAMNA